MPRRNKHGQVMLVAAMAAVLVAAVWSCTDRREEPVRLEAEVRGESSQLVIYLQRPIEYTVDRSGSYLFVRFSSPVLGDSASARRTLNSHLSELYFTNDGRVLVVRARGWPDFRHFAVGNAVVLAWTDTRRPPPSAALAADSGLPKAPQRANTNRLRPRPTGPATSALRTLSPESGTQPRAAPQESSPRRTRASESKTRPDEEAPAEAKRPPNEKSADVGPPGAPPAPSPYEKKPEEAKPSGEHKPADEAKPSPDEKKPEEAKPPGEHKPADEAKPSPDVKKPEEVKPPEEHRPADEAKPSNPEETKPSEEGKAPEATTPHEEDDVAPPRLRGWVFIVSSDKHETRLMFEWPAPTATAVFRYAGRIWIVFDRPTALGDLAAFQRQLGPGVERLTRIENAKFTILAARVQADVRARVHQKRNMWTIFLTRDGDAEPELTARLGVKRGIADKLTISLPGAVTPLRLIHPDVGGTLHIIPSRSTIAVAVDWRFATFQLVPTVQGAVIEELADRLLIEVDADTIVIQRDGGPLLSPD